MSEEAKALDADHHVIRHVTDRESPWPGVLAQDDSGALRLLVDAVDYDCCAGWDADPDGHVLAPLDIVRRPGGHDVVLPACTERLDVFLMRRRDRRLPLSAGERVTVAVSMIRGLCEAHQRAPGASGVWWITADGRPILALGVRDGVDAVPAATARVLGQLGADGETRLAAALSRAAAHAEQPRTLVREAGEIEAELFAAALPEPLATAGTAAPLTGAVGAVTWSRPPDIEMAATEDAQAGWLARIAPLVDSDLADAASKALTSVWRRLHRRGGSHSTRGRRGKRGPLLIAGAVAAGVVGIGLMWPGGGGSPARAGSQASSSPPSAVVASSAAPLAGPTHAPEGTAAGNDVVSEEPVTTAASPSPDQEVLSAVGALLTKRLTCRNNAACLHAVQEDPQRRFPEGAASLPAGERRVALLDSFGGAAVVKVEDANAPAAGAAGAQLVVVVRAGDRWRRRDGSGAEQPG
ncbi:hypothetical protein [Microbacterium candidum]|uniref:Uncharacterized protein n=1 Tax=Microbacterium candidum TaxID=3041922 RepID=A0ABT7MZ43_9MICO|nr:hypothetical protein [Microbacterium sp. ASV49]MDL9979695.1 hypothetical protein [Microbacterium sp. ASV49]